MIRMNNALVLMIILALTALLAPIALAPGNARAGQEVPTPVATPTPGAAPIVVGRVTGADSDGLQKPTVGPLTFASELDEAGLPAVPGSDFPAGTPAVYVFFDYSGFPGGGGFEQVWYVDGSEVGRDRWAWDQAESGTYRGGLNTPGGLVPGSYQLDVVMDGQVLTFGTFEVTQAPAGPWFGPITFAQGVENGQPVNPGTQFPAGTTTLYAIFDFAGIPVEAELVSTVLVGDKRITSQSSLWDMEESGKAASENLSNDRGYKVGQYRLVLSVEGVEIQSGGFEIVSGPLPTATAAPAPEPVPTATPLPPTTAPSPTPKPVWTPPPFKIVYTQVDYNFPSIWVMNLDGSGQQKLADHASDPTWSPDGSRVAFFGYDAAVGGRGVYQMKVDGSEIDVFWNEGTAQYLDWSPAGPYVAMSALNSVVVYDGKAGKWVTISKGGQPSFAPDGRQIVAKSCDGGSCGLFTMDRDGGGNRRRITMSAEDAMPAWSPTFKQIAYSSQSDGNWDIYVMNVDGSGKVRLTDDPGIDAMPAWLPDGSGIVFRSTSGGVWGIWMMNPDGSDKRKIIDSPVTDDWGRSRLDVR